METRKLLAGLMLGAFCMTGMVGCGSQKPAEDVTTPSQVATKDEMVTPETVVEDGWMPVYGDKLLDGDYEISVNSSSSMFKIVNCVLHVADGKMTADMTMGGTGYLYVYMGTGEEAARADEKEYIPFQETEAGHVFTVPVEGLNLPVDCAAFSKNKEKWYDRQLAFVAGSLPLEAYKEAPMTTVADIHLADGKYTVEVRLTGGSGKASVESPALLTVKDGQAVAKLIWSSKNYDYVRLGNDKYDPITIEPTAVFEIPVTGFDYEMPIAADTTAMSQPHEIEYTLYFDSRTLETAE